MTVYAALIYTRDGDWTSPGPAAGLAAIDELEGLDRFHLWHACRAELLVRLGRTAEAAAAFDSALACDPPAADRRHLERRIAAL